MNIHTRLFLWLLKAAIKRFEPTAPGMITLPFIPHGPEQRVVTVKHLSGIRVPARDEDQAPRPMLPRMAIKLINRLAPMLDSPAPWPSQELACESIHKDFGPYLPPSRVRWGDCDVAGDQALAWWALSGFGAMQLKRLALPDRLSEAVNGIEPHFVSAYDFLGEFPVRPGLAPYGGDLYLDALGKPLKIKIRSVDILCDSGAAWAAAKFAYRSSCLVWTTLSQHIFHSHYTVSNAMVLATQRHLPFKHPLRMLLKPFLFRTTAINQGGIDSLIPQGSAIHRAVGFTWQGLQSAYAHMAKHQSFTPFPESLRQRNIDAAGLAELPADIFPYGRDGTLYWHCVNRFCHDIFSTNPAFENISQDIALASWWTEITGKLNFPSASLTRDNLVLFLSQFIFTVTSHHSWVGHVAPYVADPRIAAGKLFPGAVVNSQQNSQQIALIASLTSLETPRLLESYAHLMPNAPAKASWERFQEDLVQVSKEIARRNQGRSIALDAFAPEKMRVSVGI